MQSTARNIFPYLLRRGGVCVCMPCAKDCVRVKSTWVCIAKMYTNRKFSQRERERVTSGPKWAVTFSFDGTGARALKIAPWFANYSAYFAWCLLAWEMIFYRLMSLIHFAIRTERALNFFKSLCMNGCCRCWFTLRKMDITQLHIFCAIDTFKAASGVYIWRRAAW